VSRIYWDSMMFIYLLEAHPVFGPKVRVFLEGMIARNDLLCSSVFSIGEVLTGPRRRGSQSGVDAVDRFFSSGSVDILPFDRITVDAYSKIRAKFRVTQADGIHLATAAEAKVDVFFTNDTALQKLSITGIKFFADADGRIV
jgi:uncharacterized protein